MARPKHDYDSDEFYALLERCASVLAYDKDVAVVLNLDEDVFSSMKSGCYQMWSADENKRRSGRINKVLTRARASSNMQAWNTVLRMGIGRYKTRSRSVRAQGRPCECGGSRPECPHCGGLGYVKDPEGEIPVTVTESENELAPSLQALTLWLHHHDPNYRRIQRGEEPENVDMSSDTGVSIEAWLRREMCAPGGQQEEAVPATSLPIDDPAVPGVDDIPGPGRGQ